MAKCVTGAPIELFWHKDGHIKFESFRSSTDVHFRVFQTQGPLSWRPIVASDGEKSVEARDDLGSFRFVWSTTDDAHNWAQYLRLEGREAAYLD